MRPGYFYNRVHSYCPVKIDAVVLKCLKFRTGLYRLGLRTQNFELFGDTDEHGYTRIILPSPPFSKGGVGGISETRFPPQYA